MAKRYVISPQLQTNPSTPGFNTGNSNNPQVLQVQAGQTAPPPASGPSLPPVRQLPAKPEQWARGFIHSSGAIPVMWGVAMGLVFVDEWREHRILARPARLWWSSIAYFILAVVAHFGPLMPIAVLIAVGLTIQLAYQYFNREGQFSGE